MGVIRDNKQPTGNELFRFVNVRGPKRKCKTTRDIGDVRLPFEYIKDNDLDSFLKTIEDLASNSNKEEALADIINAVNTYKTTDGFIVELEDLEIEFENVLCINSEIAVLPTSELNHERMEQMINERMAGAKSSYQSGDVPEEVIRLWENLITQIISPENAYLKTAIIAILKTYHLVELISKEDVNSKISENKELFFNAINAKVVLPKKVFPLPNTGTINISSSKAREEYLTKQKAIVQHREKLGEEWHEYHNALHELDKKVNCAEDKRKFKTKEHNKLMREYSILYGIYKKNLEEYNAAVLADPETTMEEPVSPDKPEQPVINFGHLDVNDSNFSEEHLTTVNKLVCLSNDNLIPIERTRSALLKKVKELSGRIATTLRVYNETILIGNSFVKINPNYKLSDFEEEITSSGDEIPEPSYSVLGVGELLKVEQEILCYEAGEVAHIENILKGEYKDRSTRDLTRREETIIREEETTTEEKRDLETTEKNEMGKEASKVVSKDFSADAGVQTSGQYGPVKVTADASVSFGFNSSTSNSSSVNYSKSVTERASNRIQKRVRTESRITVINEFEEINKHGFENRQVENGPEVENVVGIYRWVNKIYKNTLWNYGNRLMLEFMVPEPSAYHIFAKANGSNGGLIEPPNPKDLELEVKTLTMEDGSPVITTAYQDMGTPDMVNETNYTLFAANYDADVPPPPSKYKYINEKYKKGDTTESFTDISNRVSFGDFEVALPEGYITKSAIFETRIHGGNSGSDDDTRLELYVGGEEILNNSVGNTEEFLYDFVNPISEKLAISWWQYSKVGGDSYGYVIINSQIKLERTPELYQQWQAEAYNTIMQAYYRKLSEFQQQMARMQIQQGVQIQGSNPLLYQDIIKNELKKACIEMMAEENFAATQAASTPLNPTFLYTEGYEKDFKYNEPMENMDFKKAANRAPVIRFFEQAFEWEQMTYLFYPYFWANKNRWIQLYNLDDNDPLFANFLKAGAARVVVPVRQGFEDKFAYFKNTKKIPDTFQDLSVDDPDYLSVAAELKPNDFREFVESWETALPTSLVILQRDSTGLDAEGLPCWRTDKEGVGYWEIKE